MKSRRPAPFTADQLLIYNTKLAVSHSRSGLDYETGPRHGQQLAYRRAVKAFEQRHGN
jgi:hypothetical protein